VARALAPSVRRLAAGRDRVLLGLAGSPGVGKSTLAAAVVADYERVAGAGTAVVVGMDGFHLRQAELVRRGLADVKGAPETFDAEGFVSLLRRLRVPRSATTVPVFDRTIEEPVADAKTIREEQRLVVVEGNYLLLDDVWRPVRDLLDAVWHLHLPDDLRVPDLVARHVAHGRSPEAATEWVLRSDEANARLVADASARADAVVDMRTGILTPAGQ
jgi:pantothenate kinase